MLLFYFNYLEHCYNNHIVPCHFGCKRVFPLKSPHTARNDALSIFRKVNLLFKGFETVDDIRVYELSILKVSLKGKAKEEKIHVICCESSLNASSLLKQ